MRRLVLETAIGPVLPLLLGKLRAARWDSAGATAEGTQDPAPNRAAGQGLATSQWRGSAQHNSGEPGLTLASGADPGAACGPGRATRGPASRGLPQPWALARGASAPSLQLLPQSRDGLLLGPLDGHGADLQPLSGSAE